MCCRGEVVIVLRPCSLGWHWATARLRDDIEREPEWMNASQVYDTYAAALQAGPPSSFTTTCVVDSAVRSAHGSL